MARKQYQWRGSGKWFSQSGNAAVALVNPLGSGKKLLVHSFDIQSFAKGGTAAAIIISIARATVSGGYSVPLSPRDTNAGSAPSGVEVRVYASSDPASRENVFRRYWSRIATGNTSLGIIQSLVALFGVGKNRDGWNTFEINLADANVEALRLRPGEGLTITLDTSVYAQHFGASGTLVVEGTPNRTYDFTTITAANSTQSTDILSVVNDSASAVVRVKRLRLWELGQVSTPYFQLVPVGSVDPQSLDDMSSRGDCIPTDSAYGALSASHARVVFDAPLKPFGVPEAYASEGGAATPKQMNYLHTKDFIGPLYGVYFPEATFCAPPEAVTDAILAPRVNAGQLLSPGAPIVVREGEGLAVVSAAETAGNPTWCAGSWIPLHFGIQFSVEPTVIPSITVTGVVTGSDVVILASGTETVLASSDDISGTSFSWEYDADLVDTVDVCIYKEGYYPFSLRNIDPGNAGITILAAQQVDQTYLT